MSTTKRVSTRMVSEAAAELDGLAGFLARTVVGLGPYGEPVAREMAIETALVVIERRVLPKLRVVLEDAVA